MLQNYQCPASIAAHICPVQEASYCIYLSCLQKLLQKTLGLNPHRFIGLN